jgi:hypothetical protein
MILYCLSFPAGEEPLTVTVNSLRPVSAALYIEELNLWDCSHSAQDKDLVKEDVAKREVILEEKALQDPLSGHGT